MITIKTDTVKECDDYGKMCTTVQIEGDGETVKEEIKTLFQSCKSDDNLRIIVIQALTEVLSDDN